MKLENTEFYVLTLFLVEQWKLEYVGPLVIITCYFDLVNKSILEVSVDIS